MADWRSRVMLGAAVAVLAPVTARMASSGGSGGDAQGATGRGARHRPGAAANPGNGASDASSAVADLTNPRVARRVASNETRMEARRTLCSFLVLYGGSTMLPEQAAQTPAQATGTGQTGGAAQPAQESGPAVCTDPADGAVEAMIAVVPDPVRTHLALRFDRAMDDLENSAQQLGWLFDKAWLPWSTKEPSAADRLQDRYIDEQMEEQREDQPGLLLFRNDDATKPLVVLVVGDTPTGGVNKEQFRRAAEIWKSLHTQLPSGCEGPNCRSTSQQQMGQRLMVLGPSFSGSIPSLQRLLDETFAGAKSGGACDTQRLAIPVASGTVTSGVDMEKLWDMGGACRANVHVTPVTFSADIARLRPHLLRFLNDRLPQRDSGIAELTEEESQFGANAVEDPSRRLEMLKTSHASEEAILRQEKLVQILAEDLKTRPLLHFEFPRGISLLRKAYEQNGILGFGRSSGDAPKTQLQLDLEEESASGDAVPSFSGTQGASSMESYMAQIATTLEKNKVAVAVLSATDALDTIFVARYLRAHAPSVTIVIQDADLLFLRGGSDVSLDGVYVVSPYPLVPRNGVWSRDKDSGLGTSYSMAESQGDEGTVNAATYLLCGGEWNPSVSAAGSSRCKWEPRKGFDGKYLWLPEYEPPFPVAEGWENDYKLQPPLWLSVIGHGGFQPVSLIDIDQRGLGLPISSAESKEAGALSLPRLGTVAVDAATKKELPVPATNPEGIQDDESLTEMYVVLTALLFVLALHAWACTRCRLDRSFAWSYAAADEKPWFTRLIVQVSLNLIGIYALSLLLIHDQPGFHLEAAWFQTLVIGAQVLLVVLTGSVAWRSAAGGKTARAHALVMAAAVLGSAAFAYTADHWLWSFFGPNADVGAERAFFYYRSAYLLNGACPMLPVLLLAVGLAMWLRGRMAKLVFYGYRIPRVPSVGEEYRCPCNSRMRELNELLGEPLWTRTPGKPLREQVNTLKLKIAVLSAAGVGAVLLITRQLGPHSLAFSHFDELVDVAAFAVAWGIVHNLVVSMAAWHMLKSECLTPLKQSPLRWGFNWIHGFSWKRLWTSAEGFTAEAELEYVMRNVEADRRGLPALCEVSPVRVAYKDLMKKYNSHDEHTASCSVWSRAIPSAKWAEALAQASQTLYRTLALEADYRLLRLEKQWTTDFGPVTGPQTERGLHMEQKPADMENEAEQSYALQRIADEEFVALVYITYIRAVLVQIRNRIGTSAGLYMCLLWALTGYPWMNRHGILLQMSALLAVLAAAAITIYSEMQRDDILSRTTETEIGKLDGEFFSKILSVVGVPLLTLVASQFPEFSNAIFSWLVPGLSSVK